MKSSSLRGHLMKALMLPILGGILLVGVASCISTYHEAAEIYDAEQVHFAKVLHTLVSQLSQGEIINIEGVKRHDAYEKYLAFRVWRDSQLFLTSDNAKDFGPVTRTEGFTDRMIADMRWRFYVEHQNNIIIEVAEQNEVRLDLVRHILGGIFFPQLIIIPIIAIIISFGISRGLKPVEQLSQLVRKRNINQLVPLTTAGVPHELVPMVDATNDLMNRVEDARRIEKNFTNYAAHEMRTPIAALKTQAQVILRTQEPEKQKALAGALLVTIDRTERIVHQLLTYARVQHHHVALDQLKLKAVLEDELRYVVPRALEKQITIDAQELEDCAVRAQEELLRLIIANLLDNAVKYGAEHGSIHVLLRATAEGVRLHIRDDGPGISEQDLPHIFDPFYRIAGNQTSGAGLGLAIVKWACDLQHIRLATGQGIKGGGIEFILDFVSGKHIA